MDIDQFIAKYRPLWRQLETICSRGPRGLARRSGGDISQAVSLYLQSSAHLAEVRTRYHDPALESYLTRVVATAHGALYGARASSMTDALSVFGSRYRAALHRTVPQVALAGFLLVTVTLLVALWTAWSPEAQAGVIPSFAEGLVDRSPTDVRDPSASLSGFIFLNNVRVAVLAFALGITLGVGSILIVVSNAVLIGALAGTAHAFGAGGRFWALVLPHGFLELIAIAIAAGAGIRIGWSILVPGDRPRGTALVEEARDALLVLTGVVPAFLLAAGIEGLVTGVTGVAAFEIAIGAAVAAGYVIALAGWPRHWSLTAARAP